jgi:hypothetical protein
LNFARFSKDLLATFNPEKKKKKKKLVCDAARHTHNPVGHVLQ